MIVRRLASALLLLVGASRLADAQSGAPGDLRVRSASGAWHGWWRADRAPTRWATADSTLARHLRWRTVAPGLDVAELTLSTRGEGNLRALGGVAVVLVRIDPARHTLRLDAASTEDGVSWSIDDAPRDARLALNAGQFTDAGPWGWIVHDGHELQVPAVGPLSAALVVTADGRARIVDATALDSARAITSGPHAVVEAIQSYPALLRGDGDIPGPLLPNGRGIDREHRDARLAIGELRDGRLLIALTRFDAFAQTASFGTSLRTAVSALGALTDRVPLGLTVPESAALLGALGTRRAVLLDGGLSAQLRLTTAAGDVREWKGLRRVPLGLVVKD
jgi:hypothetical protein